MKKDIWDGIECEVSYYFFYKTNIIRILLRYITRHPMFENCIVVIIVASSSKLVMDTYFMNEDESNLVVQISSYFDYIFNVIFALETITKSISMGLLQDKGSYL